MKKFLQYINCPECMSENIEMFTSGWHCHTCGHTWGHSERDNQGTYKRD